MSAHSLLSEFDEGVEDGNAIAFALFLIEMFFMLIWLVDPGVSPLPSSFGATVSNFNILNSFVPLLVIILPITLFGVLKNMFQSKANMTRDAFALTPRVLVRVQSRALGLVESAQSKRAYYKKYGRGVRYRKSTTKMQPAQDKEPSI